MAIFDKVNIIKNVIDVLLKILPVIANSLDYIISLENK